ncbi:D-alanine--D-alanine ligase [Dehalogenimonas lykanthroporepellens BL-DC-9]|jgi:D-alanine-D-alanine ligase|nr:D-alanine--D-alanine ligase [Dehalogenimonas lykanthroporepellens BL-DC-9]
MRIGLAYDLKEEFAVNAAAPDDALEEYDSTETVRLIEAAVSGAGHTPIRLGGGREFLRQVLDNPVDFVFNIAEGRGTGRAREAQIPAVLEMLGIPYSGADPQTLSMALDKPLTKRLADFAGVSTPAWLVLNDTANLAVADWASLHFPVFIKPAFEGSSKGIRLNSLAASPAAAAAVAGRLLGDYRQPVLVEEFIDGDEITCGLIGNTGQADNPMVLPLGILPHRADGPFIYSLEVKRDYRNRVEYQFPARLPAPVLEELTRQAVRVFDTLNCRDFARADFRIDRRGRPWFLEINPLPGLSLDSDLYIIARGLGWSHAELIQAVLDAALNRISASCV